MEGKDQVRAVVTPEETRLAFAEPAPFANKFYIHVLGGGAMVRISFAELNPEAPPPFIRSAVILHPQDAMNLRNLLTVMLEPIESQINEAIAAEKAKQNV